MEQQTSGWQPGQKPPADYHNYLQHQTTAAIGELQTNLDKVDNTPDTEKSVASAAKLTAPRNITADPTKTTGASFNGEADISIGVAPNLTDGTAASTLPTAGTATALTTLLNTVRNCLKWLVARFDSSGNANAALKLATPKVIDIYTEPSDTNGSIQTLSLTSFDGSAGIAIPAYVPPATTTRAGAMTATDKKFLDALSQIYFICNGVDDNNRLNTLCNNFLTQSPDANAKIIIIGKMGFATYSGRMAHLQLDNSGPNKTLYLDFSAATLPARADFFLSVNGAVNCNIIGLRTNGGVIATQSNHAGSLIFDECTISSAWNNLACVTIGGTAASRVSFDKCKIIALPGGQNAVTTNCSGIATFDNCEIDNSASATGIYISGATNTAVLNILNSYIHGGYGISKLNSGTGLKCSLHGNTIVGDVADIMATDVDGQNYWTIENNKFAGYGITLGGSPGLQNKAGDKIKFHAGDNLFGVALPSPSSW